MINNIPEVFAITPDWGTCCFDFNDGGVVGGIFDNFGDPVIVEVIDPTAAGTGSIEVKITSSVDPIGFNLTLNEKQIGIFTNENLALMQENQIINNNSVEIIIWDDRNPDPLEIQILDSPPLIISDSDVNGITPVFYETGKDTNLFSAKIKFASSSDPDSNTLAAKPGDIFSVWDPLTKKAAHGFIGPNPNIGKGAIQAEIGGKVFATYKGETDSFIVGAGDGGGRGTGGLIRPGLVADSSDSSNEKSGGGGNCVNCSPPTLGLDSQYNRIVTDGFSFNNNPVDVEYDYTPYPLITANVGQENKIVLKIFDDGGTENIEHVGLAFGLGKDQVFSQSKATINLDRTLDGKEKVTTLDPENVLENIKITTSKVPCNHSSPIQCLEVIIFQTFRESLEFNIVSTNVWDSKKNAWQNTYNHGIEVVGDSMNPPKTKMVAFGEKNMRGLYELTQIDKKKHLWIDEFGSIYEHKGNDHFDRIFSPDHEIIMDKETTHGCDRNCNWFHDYKYNQKLLAEKTLIELLGTESLQKNLGESFSYDYKMVSRSENQALQETIISENLKAEAIVEKILNPWNYPEFYLNYNILK